MKTVGEVIARLQSQYQADDLIAVNWWSEEDFEGYADKEQAIKLAQDFLDFLNADLTSYVSSEYEEVEANA